MRVLVCGGRNFSDFDLLSKTLYKVFPPKEIRSDFTIYLPSDDITIIHGGARGADELAGKWADVHNIKTEVYKAKWDMYGKAAGVIRNGVMLQEGKPELVIAFPGGKGTAHMVYLAREAGIEVMEI